MVDAEQLHGVARVQVALARMDGHKFDKSQLRFNDIVHVAVSYPKMGAATCYDGMREAIDACIIGNDMHVPNGSVLSLAPSWMIGE